MSISNQICATCFDKLDVDNAFFSERDIMKGEMPIYFKYLRENEFIFDVLNRYMCGNDIAIRTLLCDILIYVFTREADCFKCDYLLLVRNSNEEDQKADRLKSISKGVAEKLGMIFREQSLSGEENKDGSKESGNYKEGALIISDVRDKDILLPHLTCIIKNEMNNLYALII